MELYQIVTINHTKDHEGGKEELQSQNRRCPRTICLNPEQIPIAAMEDPIKEY